MKGYIVIKDIFTFTVEDNAKASKAFEEKYPGFKGEVSLINAKGYNKKKQEDDAVIYI